MRRFQTCLAVILDHEGGKSDNPADRGGRTAYGITQRTYDAYRAKRGLPARDVWQIDMSEVREIYFADYWTKVRADSLPEPLDLHLFDAAVNCGVSRASKWLQQSLDMPDADGRIGPVTLAYVNDAVQADEIDYIVSRFLGERRTHYMRLVLADGTQNAFLNGWMNRVANIERIGNA